jgi:hypothetical protein
LLIVLAVLGTNFKGARIDLVLNVTIDGAKNIYSF